MVQALLSRYADLPGNVKQVFGQLCGLLSEHPQEIRWSELSAEDWSLLREMALSEGVAELGYYLLRTNPEAYHLPEFDPVTYRAWSEQEAATALRNAVLFRQVDQLSRALSAAGVPVVLLKGADLARSVYPQPGLRPMSDLDLLVPRAQFREAAAQLVRLGYEEDRPEALLGLEDLLSQNAYFYKTGTFRIMLELHWTLVGTPAFRYTAPVAWFWSQIEPRLPAGEAETLGEPHVFALNPNAHLLYLAAHQMLQHGSAVVSLREYLDVHRLVMVRYKDIAWQALANQAQQFGWSQALGACLQAAHNCFGTPLPAGLLDALKAQKSPLDALMAERASRAPTHTLAMWRTVRALKWGGRLRLVLAMLFPGKRYLTWRFRIQKTWRWPLYHLPLWGLIARDVLHTLWIFGYNRTVRGETGGRTLQSGSRNRNASR